MMKKFMLVLFIVGLLAPVLSACHDYKCSNTDIICIANCEFDCGEDEKCLRNCAEFMDHDYDDDWDD